MDISSITSAYDTTAASSSTTSSSSSSNSLGMSDFIQILAAELQYQDPTQSTDNSQYMSQMAQFSVLEQIQSLSKSFNYSLSSQMVGKSVLYNTVVYDKSTAQYSTVTASGKVDAVDLSSDTPTCFINGAWVDLSSIKTVYDSTTTAPTTDTTDKTNSDNTSKTT
ncbi:MAG TPA: flagellar hook capping FlgD N-terminal domain-containing protein [Clostridia bacterium]|nr:flagellar hook capping FlgD N-terminal domain-containing protein [Clostridia bacterium]